MSIDDVTVLVPIYTKEPQYLDWLDECLDSACSQDCKVIAYNDGSPIHPGDVMKKYPLVTYYDNGDENHGVSYARNVLAALADTELIYPLDCDDRMKPGSMQMLRPMWTGIPLYGDLTKFGGENIPHYELLDFEADCYRIYEVLGIAAVNVLHSVEQWRIIGGWNDDIDYFEDGEYNARLFINFCAKHVNAPLTDWRIHNKQRTKIHKIRSYDQANFILDMIRSHDMACSGCKGKRRFSTFNKSVVGTSGQPTGDRSIQSILSSVGGNVAMLPESFEGKVLVKYMGGKGKARHYYVGIETKRPYKVKYGDLLYANVTDTTDALGTGQSMLVRQKHVEVSAAAVKPAGRTAVVKSFKEVVKPVTVPVIEKTVVVVKQPDPEPELEEFVDEDGRVVENFDPDEFDVIEEDDEEELPLPSPVKKSTRKAKK